MLKLCPTNTHRMLACYRRGKKPNAYPPWQTNFLGEKRGSSDGGLRSGGREKERCHVLLGALRACCVLYARVGRKADHARKKMIHTSSHHTRGSGKELSPYTRDSDFRNEPLPSHESRREKGKFDVMGRKEGRGGGVELRAPFVVWFEKGPRDEIDRGIQQPAAEIDVELNVFPRLGDTRRRVQQR